MGGLDSRARVVRSLRRQPVDRVPRTWFGNPGINRRLMQHFGCADIQGVEAALGCDQAGIWLAYTGPRLHAERAGVQVDPQWGTISRWVANASGGYQEICAHPLADADVDAVRAWPMPDPSDFAYDDLSRQLAAAGDRALLIGDPAFGDLMNSATLLFGMEEVLVRLMEDDEALLHFMDRRLDILLAHRARILERSGGRVDFCWMGEDLGTQRGPIISLELFRRHIRPRLQRVVDLARRWQLPVLIHSCGSSHPFFDDLIDMGIDAVDTLQPEAAGMQATRLKAGWGGSLAFQGGLSTAGPLATAGPDAVAEQVRQLLGDMMPGGGYLFAPTHHVQDDTHVDNVLAAYAACDRHGVYG
ncbi:MAG: uroporphyrinogen decarboxylase family protein [Planctomycetota bacterium]